MPKSNCPICETVYTWRWEEAFDKLGFGDGDGDVWEPACGRSHVSKVLVDAGYAVLSTDLISRDYGIGGIDFLQETASRAKHIVTNPPYGRGLGDAFVTHALALAGSTGGKVRDAAQPRVAGAFESSRAVDLNATRAHPHPRRARVLARR